MGNSRNRSHFDPLRIGSATKRDGPQQFTVWTPDSYVSVMPDGLNKSTYGVDPHCPLHIVSPIVRTGRGAPCGSRRHRHTGNPEWGDPSRSCRTLSDTQLGDRPVDERGGLRPSRHAEDDNRTINNFHHNQRRYDHDHHRASDHQRVDSDDSVTVHPGHGRRCCTGAVHARYAFRGLEQHLEHPAAR